MSERRLPNRKDAAVAMLRTILDRLERIEKGSALMGRVSFGPVVQIGDVEIAIVDGAANDRKVVFKNTLTGSTSTIDLP